MKKVSVIGGGAWGTALAQMLAAAGRTTQIWSLEEEVVAAINTNHMNDLYLAGVPLHEDLRATSDLGEAAEAELILLVTPAQFLRPVTVELAAHLKPGVAMVICAKGIEKDTHALMSEVLAETVPGAPQAVLSGPTFAIEVAQGLPTGRGIGRTHCRGHRPASFPALLDRRCDRGANRRRGQECAGHRLRCCRGPGDGG